MKQLIILIFLSGSFSAAFAGPDWELKKDKEGIKVYAASISHSNIKAIKAECTLDASLSQLAGLLFDVKAHEQWVYCTKISYLVKKANEQEVFYYSEMSMPWPLSNRDFVIDLKITQNPATKVMVVSVETVPGYVPIKEDKIRVLSSKASWTVTPIGKNQVSVAYMAQADPGGTIPAWVINMFSAKGPFETFKKLKEILASGAYKNAHFEFIKDYAS